MTDFADDGYCFVCGPKNAIGLKLEFLFDGQTITTEFIPQKVHQGYMNIVHGGIISTLLDEVMVKLAIEMGMPAVTAHMDVRLRKAVAIGKKITFRAEIRESTRKLIIAYAKAETDDGMVADSTGKLIRIELGKDSDGQEGKS
jgi:acyl-coenzyme A thioesterase PaaI-like protein